MYPSRETKNLTDEIQDRGDESFGKGWKH